MTDKSVEEILGLAASAASPSSPEDDFFGYMTKGHAHRFAGIVWAIKLDLEHFKYLRDCGVMFVRPRVDVTNGSAAYTALNPKDFVRYMLRYYLSRAHSTRFEGLEGLPKLDLTLTTDLFMDQLDIKNLIEGADRP